MDVINHLFYYNFVNKFNILLINKIYNINQILILKYNK